MQSNIVDQRVNRELQKRSINFYYYEMTSPSPIDNKPLSLARTTTWNCVLCRGPATISGASNDSLDWLSRLHNTCWL